MKKKHMIICVIASLVAVAAAIALVLAYREKMTELTVRARAAARRASAKARTAASNAAQKLKKTVVEADTLEDAFAEEDDLPEIEVELVIPEEPELV